MAGFSSRQRPPEALRFEAEESKLNQVRREATAEFEAAQAANDFERAKQSSDRLNTASEAFREFRSGLSQDALYCIHAEKILNGSGDEKIGLLTRLVRRPRINVGVPTGISDIEALEALNVYVSERSKTGTRAVNPQMFTWLSAEGGVAARDIKHPRIFSIALHVPGTEGRTREEQAPILAERGLQFALPIEQALGGAVALCLREGISPQLAHRGAHSTWALDSSSWPIGVEPLSFVRLTDLNHHRHVVASGVRIPDEPTPT